MHIQPSWFLSHQHIAHAEMVYLHVCEITASTQSEVSTLKFFTQNPKPLIRIERLLAPEKKKKQKTGQAPRGTLERREVPAPRKTPVQAAQRDIKRTGGG